jgi:hypothetical protein
MLTMVAKCDHTQSLDMGGRQGLHGVTAGARTVGVLSIKITLIPHEIQESLIMLRWSSQLGKRSLDSNSNGIVPEEIDTESAR